MHLNISDAKKYGADLANLNFQIKIDHWLF